MPLGAFEAQTPAKVYRVGFLVSTMSPRDRDARRDFPEPRAARLCARPNLVIEMRSADGKPNRLPDLAKELAASGVEVIVTMGYAARAAGDATSTVPIIVNAAGDPVETGLAVSLAGRAATSPGSPTWPPSFR